MTDLILLDPAEFRRNFNTRAFSIGHTLDEQELFSLPRLAELAAEMPASSVEYNAGNVPVDLDPTATPGNGLSPDETVRRIEECQSWLVLKNVEQVATYREMLENCLAEIREFSESLTPGMHMPEAFIFVSSPNSITPFHIDPEHNFLLQIRGRKTMHVFDPHDDTVLAPQDLERFFSGAHRNLRFNEAWQSRASQFELKSGDGVHVPVAAPHWVQNGDEVSISFSVTFRSRVSKRNADVWQMNHKLRRIGFNPRPAGASVIGDLIKQTANRGIRLSKRLLKSASHRKVG